MKLKRWSQGILVVAAATGLGLGLISCGQSNTIDYLYATSSKNDPGQINIYRVDSESGALTQIPDSPFPTQQRNPVSLAADGPGKNLYVAFEDDNAIVQYGIGTDAKLYGDNTVNPSGSQPVAVTVHTFEDSSGNVTGSLLFVVEQYQPNYTSLNPGPGALYVYNLGTNGTLSPTPVTQTVNGAASDFYPLETNPTAVNVTADGAHAYVTDILAKTGSGGTCSAGQGGVEGFNVSTSGVLTPVAGTPFCAGTTPSAIASHPFSTFLYVTDSTQNQVIQYTINASTTSPQYGALTPLPTAVVPAGTTPDGIAVDQRGMYAYVSNYVGGSISEYAINQSTGALTASGGGSSIGTNTEPGCIIIEPALNRFVYTANNNGNSVSGFVMNPDTGALSATQGTYYNTAGLSRCVAAVSHGNHPINYVQPTAGNPGTP